MKDREDDDSSTGSGYVTVSIGVDSLYMTVFGYGSLYLTLYVKETPFAFAYRADLDQADAGLFYLLLEI